MTKRRVGKAYAFFEYAKSDDHLLELMQRLRDRANFEPDLSFQLIQKKSSS